MREAVIVSTARTGLAKSHRGGFNNTGGAAIAGHAIKHSIERAGIVTFTLPEAHAHDVATLLDREAVAIRAGHHCTQPLHERLGETATGRASFNVYSTTEDVDRLAAGLRGVQRIFGRAPASASTS